MIEVTPSESGITVVIGSHSGSSSGGYSTPAEVKTAYESNADTNAFTDAEKAKLGAVEDNATADQTGAEIKAAYEAEADTNAFTDAEKTKLTNIEDNATADQTGAEIKAAYEAEADTNAFTDAEKTKLTNIEDNATADQTGAEIKAAYEAEANTNAFTDAEKTKLAGLESSKFLGTYTSLAALQSAHASPAEGSYGHVDAGAGNEVEVYIWDNDDDTYYKQLAASSAETAASIKTKYESNADTNAFTDAEKSKLASIENNATADQTGAEIKAAYEAEADTNAFTDAEKSKLSNIENNATADQTGAEIVALYDSLVAQVSAGEITAGTETAVRRFSPKDVADIAAAHGGGGGGAYGDSVPLEIGDAADLSLEHDGTNSKVTSITGDLIFDNQNSIGSTEFHLGSDSSTTELNVKDDSGNNLFNVIGDGTVNIGSATKDGTLCIESYAGLWQTFKRGGVSIANLLYSSNGIALNTLVASRPFGINYRGTNIVTFKESIDYILFQNRAVTMPEFTTTVRDTLSVPAGTMIWNSTNTQLEIYNGASWAAV